MLMTAWNWLLMTARDWSLAAMLIRLTMAGIVGASIGIDRSMKRRGAGIKTHVLVCLGSAIVMMTSQYISFHFTDKADVSRLGAQVISGVGFLGVGTIIVTGKNQVRGLTTAAGLWTCACIGLAAGIGYVEGALLCLFFVLFTFKFLNIIDRAIHEHARIFDVYLEFESNRNIARFIEEMRNQKMKISDLEISKSKIEGEGPTAICTIEVREKRKRSILLDILREIEGIKFVEEL